jgi:regulator of protease activity HflC (stomatin/prohibitin superfamily)
MWILYVLGALAFILLFSMFFIVRQQTLAVIERFGRFKRVASAGLNVKVPFIDRIAATPTLRIQQLDVQIETKTKDNVFIICIVSVQYCVRAEKVVEAVYKLQNPQEQITAYVFDTVRARVPSITLDDVFQKKDDIALAVKKELDTVMEDFGYNIIKTLVTDINPDQKVKSSMNEINAAQRMRDAAIQQAEAEKIRVVKAAEAEAESKALQGKGIADQRKAIIDGLKVSVENFSSSVDGTNAQDVMNLVLMTQYFDTLKDIGLSGKSNTILIPHSPGGMNDISEQMRNAIITANEVSFSSGENVSDTTPNA